MGDAVVEPEVRGESDDTVDGAERPASHAPVPVPVPGQSPAIPYDELPTVERRHYEMSGDSIGKGGMGRVFKALDLRLNRTVAIKRLLPKHRDARRRFVREARITARLQHPAIIHIYEAGVWEGGEPFYAMPIVPGRSLDEAVAECTSLRQRLGLLPNVIAIVHALAYAHSQRVIHRDLKPKNVVVGRFGETVVIDWGLAKELDNLDPTESMRIRPGVEDETHAGSVIGTPAYMPPEQARDGGSVDQRADVYSLGALLYHVLVGAAPYQGTTSEVIKQVKTEAPYLPVTEREPAAPPELVTIIDKAMKPKPGDRYADANELAKALENFQTGKLVEGHRYTRRELLLRFVRRHRVAIAVSATAVAVLAILATVSITRILDEKRLNERRLAQIVEEKQLNERRRNTLLEDRGRSDLLAGNAGRALAYLAGAAHDGETGGARGFLIAEAMRPFEGERARFEVQPGRMSIAYSPDGKQIATIGNSGIDLWNEDHVRIATISIDRPPLGILFERSGKRIVAIHDDNAVRIWSLETRKAELELKHSERVVDVAISPDGTQLVSASDDGALLWNLATAESVVPDKDFCHKDHGVYLARFSEDGNYVATVGDDLVCVWNAFGMKDKSPGGVRTVMRSHRDKRVTSLRWSSDGNYVLTASTDGYARLWYPDKGKDAIHQLRHDSRLGIASADISRDGRYIVTAGLDHIAQIWELPNEIVEEPLRKATPVGKPLVGHADAIDHVMFDKEGTIVVTGGRDGKARLWNAANGQPLATFEHADAVTSIELSPDRTRLLTNSQDGKARSWDITKGVASKSFEVDTLPNAIAVTEERTVAVAGTDSRVILWRDGEESLLRGHQASVLAVAFSPDGRLLASAGQDAHALLWNVATGEVLADRLGPFTEHVTGLAFSPDGAALAVTDGATVQLWAVRGHTLVRTLTHNQPIIAIAYRDASLLAALDAEGAVVFWDPNSRPDAKSVEPVAVKRVMNGVGRALAFSRDGKRLVVGGHADARVFPVVSSRLGDELGRLAPPTGNVRAVAFTADGSRVITAGADGIAKVWDATKGSLVGIRDARGGEISSIAQSPDGDTLWTASHDRGIRSWNIRVEARSADKLDEFLKLRVPWCLDSENVVKPRIGECHGQHRTDGQ